AAGGGAAEPAERRGGARRAALGAGFRAVPTPTAVHCGADWCPRARRERASSGQPRRTSLRPPPRPRARLAAGPGPFRTPGPRLPAAWHSHRHLPWVPRAHCTQAGDGMDAGRGG
ncbi:hypothetical protein EI555_003470, partial [Monodon monoceros]